MTAVDLGFSFDAFGCHLKSPFVAHPFIFQALQDRTQGTPLKVWSLRQSRGGSYQNRLAACNLPTFNYTFINKSRFNKEIRLVVIQFQSCLKSNDDKRICASCLGAGLTVEMCCTRDIPNCFDPCRDGEPPVLGW